MSNKKRPAVSDTTLTRRYNRLISDNNNVEQIASLDDCVDDIILSIASYLTSCELLKLALTCKRFGARSTGKVRDKKDDVSENNVILSGGSRAFARPSLNGTEVLLGHERTRTERSRTFMKCVITYHSHITQTYGIKFQNPLLKMIGNNRQCIHKTEVVSIKDMKRRVERSLRFCVNRYKDTISIRWRFMADNQPWKIESEFVESIATSMLERVKSQLERREWSLMEESALQKSLRLLPKDGCLMWREGESWMGVCRQFEKELDQLVEEDWEFEKSEDAVDLDQFLVRASELSRYLENDIAELSSSRDSPATSFFQLYSNTSSKPLKECHMRGVSSMVGLYENGISGVLIDDGMGRRIQTALFLACLRSNHVAGPFIIVAPLSLIPHWIKVFKQLSNMTVTCLSGTEEERKSMYSGRLNSSLRKRNDFPVIITSYEVAITDSEQLNEIGEYTYFIMDEGEGFERYRCELLCLYFSKRFRADNLFFLTSGPIKSDLKELTILLGFCNPRIFNNCEHLLSSYDDNGKQIIAAKLQNILKPHIHTLSIGET